MKTRFIFLTVLFLLVLSLPVLAKDNWITIRSKNFTLISNGTEKDLRDAAVRLERFRVVFAQQFPGVTFHNSTPTTVVVFRNGSSYNPFRPKTYKGKPATDITGYTYEGSGMNYITVVAQEKKDTYEQIFHMYAHAMMDNAFGKIDVPAWLTEGIAEYYQTLQVKDGKITLGTPSEFNQFYLQNSRLSLLGPFSSETHYSMFRNGRDSNYSFSAQSWALVHYLLHDKGLAGKNNFQKYISLLSKKTPQEQAFREAFGVQLPATESALEKYVQKTDFATSSPMLTDTAFFGSEAVATPVSDADANAHLAELLFEANELAEGEKYARARARGTRGRRC